MPIERISIYDANRLTARYIIAPILIVGVLFFALMFGRFDFSFIQSVKDIGFWIWMLWYCVWIVVFLVAVLIGIVVHEGIHGLFIGIFAPSGFKALRFGFDPKTKSPFAHSTQALKAWQMIVICLAPMVILGTVPFVLALWYGSLFTFIFSLIFIISAGGDILYTRLLLKVPMGSYIKDLPDAVGFNYE